jgi:hypothetical protein
MRRDVESLMVDSSGPGVLPLVQVFATSISQRPASYTDHPRRLGVTQTAMAHQLDTTVGHHLSKATD